MLKFVAGTLQHVKFSEVKNVDVDYAKLADYSIVLPAMRKLRGFELVQSQWTDRRKYGNSVVTPRLVLKFNGGEDNPAGRLVYLVTFIYEIKNE